MAHVRVLAAALRRAGLVAVVLAIVAGIFGMHVVSGDHSAHAVSPAVGRSAGHTAVAHSAGHNAAGHSAAIHSVPRPASTDEQCGPSWPNVQERAGSCTPSAKAGSLAVLPPGATAALHADVAAGGAGPGGYSYRPSGPTPCELCISRT